MRPWRPQDRHAVLALNTELQEHERARRPSRRPGPEMTEEYVAALEAEVAGKGEDGAVFVAEAADGRVLGFVTCFIRDNDLERDRRELRIDDLVVAEAARRQGIGRALMKAACDFACQRGVLRVMLSVLTVNVGAAAAYTALGFRPVLLTLEHCLSSDEPVER